MIYFRQGFGAQLPAREVDGRLECLTAGGRLVFPRELITKRVVGFDPESEWPGRWARVRTAPSEARYEAIWWAIENGLTQEVVTPIAELHRFAPDHAPTARMASILERLARPCGERDLGPFKQALGITVSQAHSPHILLLHQHTEAEAARRLALLERVLLGYYLTFAAQGIELDVPDKALVFTWVAARDDYRNFLNSQGASAFSNARGFFHPTWNAVIAHDTRGSDEIRDRYASIESRRDELRRFQATTRGIPARARLRVALPGESPRVLSRGQAEALAQRLDAELSSEILKVDLDRDAIDDGTAAHELIHLLAANSGLYPINGAFPIWLKEGLATQFEVIRGGRWAGIGRSHDLRLPDWRRIQPPPGLAPLLRDQGFGRGYSRDLYAEAWALTFYLRTQHPQQFLAFLDLLRAPNPPSPSEAFRRALGKYPGDLEPGWHAFMATVQTPLERHAPSPVPSPSRPQRQTPKAGKNVLPSN